MSESPAKVQPSPVLRQKSVQSGGSMPRTFGHSDPDNGPETPPPRGRTPSFEGVAYGTPGVSPHPSLLAPSPFFHR